MTAAPITGPTKEPALNIPPRIESDLARIAIGTCSVIQLSLAKPKTAAAAPTINTPAPSMNRFSANRLANIPTAATALAAIIAFRSPKASTNLAAGISATNLPIIIKPVMKPAVARFAPKSSAVAGMLGIIPNSAVEKRKDGR